MTDLFCAIPARGGSERLPRKNLALLAGLPLIAHSIRAARAAGCFAEVHVATDDPEIAAVARDHGAVVPTLAPAELTGPLVASHRPCQWLHAELGSRAEVLVCLQPTSPRRSADDIRAGIERFRRGDVDFVVSVTRIDPHYFHWAVVRDEQENGRLYFEREGFIAIERPLLPPVYRPNGAIKIGRLDALKRAGHFFARPFGTIEMPEERSVHVAEQFHLDLCRLLAGGRTP